MGEKKKMKKALNERIFDATDRWKTPFSDDSLTDARIAILGRIRIDVQDAPAVGKSIEKGKPPLVRKMNPYSWIKVAASLAILVAIPFVIGFLGQRSVENRGAVAQWVSLPDESRVQLSAGAAMEYNEWIWLVNRRVDFSGEGYFEVKPGSDFYVYTPSGEVGVLGTTFSIWADKRRLLVHCNTGSVMVYSDNQERVLNANEFIRRQNGEALTLPQKFEHSGAYLPTKEKILVYDNAPIGVVLEQISKSTGMSITSHLEESLRYSGALNVDEVNESFQLLCKPFGATYNIDAGGTVTILP